MCGRVKRERERRNLSQETLAELINTSTANYCKKEQGSIRFSLSESKVIADYFGMTIEELFFDSGVSIMETNLSS